MIMEHGTMAFTGRVGGNDLQRKDAECYKPSLPQSAFGDSIEAKDFSRFVSSVNDIPPDIGIMTPQLHVAPPHLALFLSCSQPQPSAPSAASG